MSPALRSQFNAGVSESSLTYLAVECAEIHAPDVAARAVTVSQKLNDRLLTVHAPEPFAVPEPASKPLMYT